MLIGVIAEELLLPFVDLGNIIAEAASAADVVDAAAVYGVAVDEAATAVSTQDATTVGAITGTVDEAATAASTQDATTVGVGTVDEAATAASTQDATVTGAAAARSAMLPEAFVNSDTSRREANVAGIMVNV